jgi:L-xylulokinase
MFADVSGIPVETIDTRELGALGCAMAAAVMAGEYSSLKTAASKMVRTKETIQPNPSLKDAYERKYERFKRVVEALDPFWDGMSQTQRIQAC